ncbi:Protein of unknown function [Propionibacterium freudenreichii]|nr:Protein of unknown function [Propionibacterium freudenreichii]CEH09259.1 Protein of unknown function [Propionibacterium freudenreichii]CEI46780.1 Protein of unknown function [Propionibacterium freudenreichii]
MSVLMRDRATESATRSPQ